MSECKSTKFGHCVLDPHKYTYTRVNLNKFFGSLGKQIKGEGVHWTSMQPARLKVFIRRNTSNGNCRWSWGCWKSSIFFQGCIRVRACLFPGCGNGWMKCLEVIEIITTWEQGLERICEVQGGIKWRCWSWEKFSIVLLGSGRAIEWSILGSGNGKMTKMLKKIGFFHFGCSGWAG